MKTTESSAPRDERRRRRRAAEKHASRQGGVLTLKQAYESGLTRSEVRADLRAGRWRRVGRQCVVVHGGPLDERGREWVAVLEAGPRACLDGASSLLAAGLQGFAIEAIRVSVPRGARVVHSAGADVRQTRRWRRDDVLTTGIPRTQNAVAGVRAVLWARTEREAALVVTMAVQQRLTTPGELTRAMMRVRRDRRRMFLHDVVLELAGGAESLGEVDLARECRVRGLPEPTRQVVRQGPKGRYFLDVAWEAYGVVLEIDGIHHAWAQNVVGDALRQNHLALRGDLVLHLPLLGLRLAPDEFFAQITEALRRRGWQPGRAAA